ncbi:CUB and sushi domain-containing protein 3 [Mizuhopecten yessoensis]|uniref:CUB and sushi domain-containing protein 3 n=1 Tax=Mizuhopecten yessoensis TaxID=6573 RepID=A0A210QWC1_MIZYE|nr:CUB and sushi domain-containing protein 3 [Mizuhopecten yessoensis]
MLVGEKELGADSSSICTGTLNHVTSSENYTEVIIDIWFSPNQNCTLVIESGICSGDSGVEVEILPFFISAGSLTIYDGPSSKYPVIPLQGSRFYRVHNLPSKRSSGRFLTLVLLFKYDNYHRIFSLRYRNTPIGRFPSNTDNAIIENSVSDTCGEEILIAYQESNFITSPGYPREYDKLLNCKWTVISDDKCNNNVIQITIHTMSLGGSDDELIIYDGDSEVDPVLATLSGQEEPQVITTSGTTVVLMFWTNDTAPGQGFNLSYTRKRATPLLAESVTINITKHTAVMAVDFISGTPHRAVYWSKNGFIIPEDDKHTFTVTPASVTMEPDISLDGFTATLRITEPVPPDFGLYKVAVVNRFGLSERVIFLRRGNSVPVIKSHTVFPDNATIMVTFSSHSNFKISWYKRQRLISYGSEVSITTALVEDKYNGEANEALFKSVLGSTNPTELDYVDYMCIIRNDIGTTEISLYMGYPEKELPKLLVPSPTVEISDQEIILSVNFDSNIAYPSATWFIGDVQIEISDKYSMELKWEGIYSPYWTTNGYPSHLRSNDQRSVIDIYTYPHIGGSRSSTQPNAHYTAVLTISKITSEDFGFYRVVLENEAGKSHHVIGVPIPEVFLYVTCDQADTTRLVCNVTSCSSIIHSWIHSVDGEVIRNLPGDQDGTLNTLTIPLCMYLDAGTYTCIATDEESGNNVKLSHDRTTLAVRAVPVILESAVAIQSDGIHLEVPFFSNPPHRWVTWHRNGYTVGSPYGQLIETGPRNVILPMYGKMCSKAGNVTSVYVHNPTTGDFGKYKVTIGNEMGSSEHFINVQNPLYA